MQIRYNRLAAGALALLAAAMTGTVGCIKEHPEQALYDSDTSRQQFGNVKLKEKKVLLIGIDGANAQVVKNLDLPVIKGLLPSSIYTFNGLADTVTTVATGWTTLSTGVAFSSHRISDSTLIPMTDKGGHTDIKYYDPFIATVKLDDVETKVTVVTAWEDMTSFLLSSADNIINTAPGQGDAGVETAALGQLAGASPDILLVHLDAPAIAGQTSGFSASNAAYVKAITETDTRIGKLIDAMKARKTFADEDWLVIIQSTSGGAGTQLGSKAFEARQTFTVYYNPALVPAEYTKEHKIADNVVRFNGGASSYVRAVNNDGGLYNVGNGAISVEAKVKFNKNAAGTYSWNFPPLISKVATRISNTPGWSLFKNGDKIAWFVADGSKKSEPVSKSITDGNWHVVSATAYKQGNDVITALYIDGENKVSGSIAGSTGSVTTTSPFILGWLQDPNTPEANSIDMYLADVRVWNAPLTDAEVKQWAFTTGDLSKHPKYANLVGYWPAQDGAGGVLKDLSPSKKDFTLQGKYTWNFMGDSFEAATSNPPSLIDVVPSMYYWLGITLEGNKKPVGTNWIKLKVQ
ncbi:LamG-like jellyroll fold domain-containing protein [Chitinophaga lutea]